MRTILSFDLEYFRLRLASKLPLKKSTGVTSKGNSSSNLRTKKLLPSPRPVWALFIEVNGRPVLTFEDAQIGEPIFGNPSGQFLW